MELPQKPSILERELDGNTYAQLCEYLKSCSSRRQQTLLSCLTMYIYLLSPLFNKRDNTEINSCFLHIQIHLCSRLKFSPARQYYLYILDFIYFLQKVNCLDNDFIPPNRISSLDNYEELKLISIPITVLEKIQLRDNNKKKLTILIKRHCSAKLESLINSYMETLNKLDLYTLKISLAFFLESNENNLEWYKSKTFIENILLKYDSELSLRPPNERPTSRSLFISLRKFLSHLIEVEYIDSDINLPRYQPRTRSLLGKKDSGDRTRRIGIALNKIEKVLDAEAFTILEKEVACLGNNRMAIDLINDLVKYIELLKGPLNSADIEILPRIFNIISVDISTNYVPKSALTRIDSLATLLEKLFNEPITLYRPTSKTDFNRLKNTDIPELIGQQIATRISSQEALENTLEEHCSHEVRKRLIDFVNSYKPRARKSHRKPWTDFLNQLTDSTKNWEKHPEMIQSMLINYRDNMLKDLNRTTVYERYQSIKNGLKVLLEHGLLPKTMFIPNNIRISTNATIHQRDNPLILQLDLYDSSKQQIFISSKHFLQQVQSSLSNNLNQLLSVSKEIIVNKYSKFLKADEVIAKGQEPVFFKNDSSIYNKPKMNIFGKSNLLALENKVSYFDCFFDKLIRNERPHQITELKIGTDVIEHFGLTPIVASAMQIIITEELGFNPHSLYEAVITSPKRGEVYILVNDEGSVRVKVYKKRAKHIREKTVKGIKKPLNQISASEIDAATCFKIALEMSERTRIALKSTHLWNCMLIASPSGQPSFDTFQTGFNKIRQLAFEKSGIEALKQASLKKVRSSKGVLIYLESKGDILKATNYFGNQVETALKNYIPSYLSEMIYRIKIRVFQNIFLYMSLSNHDDKLDTLNLTEESFTAVLEDAFKNPDMGGALFTKLKSQPTSEELSEHTYFCLSEKNIALALKYIGEGRSDNLKAECEAVISKLSQGPTPMKEMLRNAHRALKD